MSKRRGSPLAGLLLLLGIVGGCYAILPDAEPLNYRDAKNEWVMKGWAERQCQRAIEAQLRDPESTEWDAGTRIALVDGSEWQRVLYLFGRSRNGFGGMNQIGGKCTVEIGEADIVVLSAELIE